MDDLITTLDLYLPQATLRLNRQRSTLSVLHIASDSGIPPSGKSIFDVACSNQMAAVSL